MASTPISSQPRKAGDTIRRSVSFQVTSYAQKFEPLSDLHDQLLKNLIKTKFSVQKAESTAKGLLGSGKIIFAGIDGTEYTNRMFDIVAFFGGSYAVKTVFGLPHIMLLNRKREFTVRPYILFVWDEAQEFVSAPSNLRGIDRTCSEEVERLLRQGRKYGLGGCIATQRIAYLNTNALQQLHTYFVSTLPRPYDRGLISNTFMIYKAILEKTLEFVPGEWLVSSYLATGMANIPIFVKADNAENESEVYLETLR